MSLSSLKTLPKRDRELIDRFAEAAKSHGWMEDQGTGSDVDHAREEYDAAFAALEKRMLHLNKRASTNPYR